MNEASHQPGADSRQSQDVQVGRDFHVEGAGHRVDFSQTHIETQIIQHSSMAGVQSRPLIPASPYKGLKKFEATDRERFFGRESLVAELLTHLIAHRCLILLGASGSGKSSLVRAGVIPKLVDKQGADLVDLVFTPDEDPFDSLYASLLGHFKQAEARLARRGDGDTLIQVVQQLQAPNTPWVIFVDQFEELFTISHPQKREAFIASLLNLQRWMAGPQGQSASATSSRSLYLILAMRADFLDQFAPYRELGQLTERYLRFVTNMGREDLQRAIANPANLHGVAFQEGLLREILNDLQAQPGELPLLQYTLDLLWKNAPLEDRLICCDTYWAIEGVQGALRRHVNEIYDRLSPADQRRARQIFLSLVDTSTSRDSSEGSSKAVSRRAYLSQFADPETRRVLIHLIDANLLVSNWQRGNDNAHDRVDRPSQPTEDWHNGAASPQATVELAHETLIRSWSRLQTWLTENQAVINLKHRLSDEARHWHTLTQTDPKQASDELWRGSKLEQVVELQQEGVFTALFGGLDAAESEFIQAAVDERDRQRREQEERRQQELRLYRNFAIGAGTALAVIIGLGTAATLGWRAAQRQEIEALTTAANASFIANRHSLDTLVAALEAGDRLQDSFWFRNDPTLQADALQVVSQAVYWVREQGNLSGHSQGVDSVAISPDKLPEDQLIATADWGSKVRIWTSQGEELDTLIEQEQPFSYVKFSLDGSILAIADHAGKVTLWSRHKKSLQPLGHGQNGHQKVVREVSFHPTKEQLATASDDGTVKIWDLNGRLLETLKEPQGEVDAVAYSPDGRFLVAGTRGTNPTVVLWDSNGKPLQTVENFPSSILHLSFSRGGEWLVPGVWLAIALDDGTVEIRQLDSNESKLLEPETVLTGHSAGVTAVQFSPNGTEIATASKDNTAKIWNRFGQEILSLEGHEGRLNGLDFNATGTVLTTASDDNTVKLWDLDSPYQKILTEQKSPVYSISFTQNGLLATASADQNAPKGTI
ncbi:MAG: WD40 repeat domain-containing protein, partial [Nodosilinea sp.]